MNYKFVRPVSLLVGAMMCSSLFFGCAPKGQSSNADANKLETITVWNNDAHSKELITKMIADFNNTVGAEKGIKIEYTVHGGDYKKIIDMAITSEQMPDLFKAVGSRIPYVKNGNLLPIEEMPGGSDFLKKYEGKLTKDREIINGKTYEVPFSLTTFGLIYNKDLFKKAGIVNEKGEAKPPETWEEVREYAKKLTDPAAKTYGIALPMKWESYFDYELIMPYNSSVGTQSFSPKTGKFNYSAYEPAFEWLLQIKKDNTFFPGAEGLDNDSARVQFAEGRVGMIFGASWDVGVFNSQFIAKNDWGVAQMPVVNVKERHMQPTMPGAFAQISSAAKKKNRAKVFEVYKWLNSDDFLTKMYEEGKYIPYNSKIIESAKNKSTIKGWDDFGAMSKVSKLSVLAPVVKLEGDSKQAVFLKLWSGATQIKAGLADLDKRYNDALEKGVKDGDVNLSNYLNPNYDDLVK